MQKVIAELFSWVSFIHWEMEKTAIVESYYKKLFWKFSSFSFEILLHFQVDPFPNDLDPSGKMWRIRNSDLRNNDIKANKIKLFCEESFRADWNVYVNCVWLCSCSILYCITKLYIRVISLEIEREIVYHLLTI